MKIITYTADDPETPERHRAIARIRTVMPGAKGASKENWHPVIFTGPTAGAVRAQAEAWWSEELARIAPKPPRKPKAAGQEFQDGRDHPAPAAAEEIGDVL